jgi:hypothetical protein
MKLDRVILWIVLGLVGVMLGGCSIGLPTFPKPIGVPDAQVAAVRVVESSDVAGRYMIYVTLTNPNNIALPIEASDYSLTVAGKTYKGDTPPQATVPASGSITVKLPAVIPGGGGGGQYDVSGGLTLHPPGQIKQILYDIGVPMPQARFSGKGTAEADSPAPADPAKATVEPPKPAAVSPAPPDAADKKPK